jgi:DinB family protein
MRMTVAVSVCATLCLPVVAVAQAAPVADAFRVIVKRVEHRLIASAEEMPAEKYGYKPTAAQMTVGEIVVHLAEDNDDDCSRIGGTEAPKRTTISPTDGKPKLVARLKETFAYCDRVLASLDDKKIGEQVSVGAETETRAQAILDDCGHWADHYSQFAMYLRLNGLLPPTATDPSA